MSRRRVFICSAAVTGACRPGARLVPQARRRRSLPHPGADGADEERGDLGAAAAHQAQPGRRQRGLQ